MTSFLSGLFRKRRALTDLSSLDDRMLRDIGISRADIGGLLAGPRSTTHRNRHA